MYLLLGARTYPLLKCIPVANPNDWFLLLAGVPRKEFSPETFLTGKMGLCTSRFQATSSSLSWLRNNIGIVQPRFLFMRV